MNQSTPRGRLDPAIEACMPVIRIWERIGVGFAVIAVLAHRGAPIPSLLTVAVLVIVPFGLSAGGRSRRSGVERLAMPWLLPAGGLAAASLWAPIGWPAAGLAIPWLLVCLGLALGAVAEAVRGKARLAGMVLLGDLSARCFVPIGAAWLVASRAGFQPMGFVEPIVSLTAIHFHFAGFAAPILAARGLEHFGVGDTRSSILKAVVVGTTAGPWLLAAGFVVSPLLKVIAVAVIGGSLTLLSLITLTSMGEVSCRGSRILLRGSSAFVLIGMALAAVYAVGEYTGEWWLLIGDMERTHGWIQGVGFALLGLVAWRWEDGCEPDTFRLRTPSGSEVRGFADANRDCPLSFERADVGAWWRNRGESVVGEGAADFRAARSVVWSLRMFPEWITLGCDDPSFPSAATEGRSLGEERPTRTPQKELARRIELGRIVVVGARMFRLCLALNACRVVQVIDDDHQAGFVYGTVLGHLMKGEEIFLVRKEQDGRVFFLIESYSRPAHPLSWIVLPWVRQMQKRFVRDAISQLRSTVEEDRTSGEPDV